jgi:hypothetical protein
MVALLGVALWPWAAAADQLVTDDLIVSGGLCAGPDCQIGEDFDTETVTIRATEPRLMFHDTSPAPYSSTDWRIGANGSGAGGANMLFVENARTGGIPLAIEDAAGPSAVHVGPSGLGLGTALPQREIHVVDGDTPGLRLEQDGTLGYPPRIWDIGANEHGFFLRDFTGFTRPLRVQSGAPDDALFVAADGRVGIGITDPQERLHVFNDAFGENSDLRIQSLNAAGPGSGNWEFAVRGVDGEFAINDPASPGAEFLFRGQNSGQPGLHVRTGSLHVRDDILLRGRVLVRGQAMRVPDFVFSPGYVPMSLEALAGFIEDNGHLPHFPPAEAVQRDGLDLVRTQMALLQTIEELTLHVIELDRALAKREDKPSAQVHSLDRKPHVAGSNRPR